MRLRSDAEMFSSHAFEVFPSTISSSSRRRLLISWDSDHVAIERNGSVDRGRFVSREQPVRVRSCAHDTVEAPDILRFAIQEIHGLYFAGAEERYEEIVDRADVLDLDYEPDR